METLAVVLGAFLGLIISIASMIHNRWVVVYECENCGNYITNKPGEWDREFFLDDYCNECGESKIQFRRLGKAQTKLL